MKKKKYSVTAAVFQTIIYERVTAELKEKFKIYIIRNWFFFETCKLFTIEDTLAFWRNSETQWPMFLQKASVAKKYLGIPATSGSVERMFSVCGFYSK